MGISPSLLLGTFHIPQGDVHTTNEAYPAIYHAQLAVVAIIHLAGKGRETHRHKGMHVDARISHSLEEGILHLPAAHIIIDEAYLHALFRLVYQGISHQIAQGVVFQDISIQMDMVLSLPYII